jgi:hypothetical protein
MRNIERGRKIKRHGEEIKEYKKTRKKEEILSVHLSTYRMGWSGLDWIDMAQDRDQWRALVNTVLNLRVP